jgi:alpha-tubulin suppressor-like RCC1 family protein
MPAGLDQVTAISAGAYHSMALKADGTVVAWGDDEWGQTDVPGGLPSFTERREARFTGR